MPKTNKELLEENIKLKQQLHFIWRLIDKLKGSKPHDRPEKRWKEYIDILTRYPLSPYKTGNWFENAWKD